MYEYMNMEREFAVKYNVPVVKHKRSPFRRQSYFSKLYVQCNDISQTFNSTFAQQTGLVMKRVIFSRFSSPVLEAKRIIYLNP